MAGRKQFDVDTAVDSAMKVFWTYGYPHTSVDALAEATGLGKGSIYATFGSKAALFQRALDRYSEIYGARYLTALSEHANDPPEAIRAFFDAILARLADPGVPDGCLITQSVADNHALDPLSRAHAQLLLDMQTARVRKALEPTGLGGAKLDDLARLVVSVNQGMTVMHRAGVPVKKLRSMTRVACRLIEEAVQDAAGAPATKRAP